MTKLKDFPRWHWNIVRMNFHLEKVKKTRFLKDDDDEESSYLEVKFLIDLDLVDQVAKEMDFFPYMVMCHSILLSSCRL